MRTTAIPAGKTILILGCGYTGSRVAKLLTASGHRVIATTRSGRLPVAGVEVRRLDLPGPIDFSGLPDGVLVLHSIPTIDTVEYTPDLLAVLGRLPARIVYLSTTGVYGGIRDVDERTSASPRTAREQLRTDAEQAVLAVSYSALVLRPAAIYGPGRGIHVSMPAGKFRLAGEGLNFVSRIHVDDLAAISAAALLSDVTGAYPVADEHPCTSIEIARYCAELLDTPVPQGARTEALHETRRADRRVDGRAICKRLGVSLRYPSYREGIPASLSAVSLGR